MADEARGDVERGEGKALSLGDQADRVRLAFYQEFNRDADYWTEYVEVYGDFLIAESMERYYRVDYQMAAEGITFTPREQWVEVEKDWTPIGQGGDAAAGHGSLVINSATSLTLTLDEAATALLRPWDGLVYDVQRVAGGQVTTLTAGTAHVVADVTRATT